MSEYLERAKEVRKLEDPHYNCCQGVLAAFAKECGISEEQAYAYWGCWAMGTKRP